MAKTFITGKRSPLADEQPLMLSAGHGNGIDRAGFIEANLYGDQTSGGRTRYVTTRFTFAEIDELKAFADRMREKYPNIDLSQGPGSVTLP
jgi:hypothetical protein